MEVLETHMPAIANFVDRDSCIACGASSLSRVSGGSFREDPVRSFIEDGIWGVQPMPYIEEAEWQLASCNDCGQMFHRYILAPEWQETRFSKWMGREAIDEFERSRGMDTPAALFRANQERTEHILRLETLTYPVRGDEPIRLLDFGCGDAEIVRLARIFGVDSYGLDRDAHRRGDHDNVYPDLAQLDAAANGKFHAVLLIEVLEHLDDPMMVLCLIHERMVPDGVLVIEVPNCQDVTGISSSRDFDLVHPLDHINCFTPDSLKAFAQRAGFRVIPTPAAYVTADPASVLKTFVKSQVSPLLQPMTRFYFRRNATS